MVGEEGRKAKMMSLFWDILIFEVFIWTSKMIVRFVHMFLDYRKEEA